MPTPSKPAKTPPPGAKTPADKPVRVRDVERDPGAILRRAALKPVRVSAKDGARLLHIVTIRRGERTDPAWAGAMPVTIVALKRRAGRILHLASGLQIALCVQVSPRSAEVYFIEPGAECLEFAALRLGSLGGGAALLKTALRRSPLVRAAADAAAKQAEARRHAEVASLQGRIATLERAAKKHADLAEALKTSEAAAKQSAAERDEEVQALKGRIAALQRAAKRTPAPQALPPAAVESDPAAPISIAPA